MRKWVWVFVRTRQASGSRMSVLGDRAATERERGSRSCTYTSVGN